MDRKKRMGKKSLASQPCQGICIRGREENVQNVTQVAFTYGQPFFQPSSFQAYL